MPLPRQEVDATTPKYLRDKYAIVGVGETTYTRGSNKTTRALGTWAVRNAILDAGLQPSELVILAARPSMGKTALALNIAENVALRQRQPVAVFSLACLEAWSAEATDYKATSAESPAAASH